MNYTSKSPVKFDHKIKVSKMQHLFPVSKWISVSQLIILVWLIPFTKSRVRKQEQDVNSPLIVTERQANPLLISLLQ